MAPEGQADGQTLPPEAYTGAGGGGEGCPSGCQWSPPGIRQPWPRDEYLCDGGDGGKPVGVNARKEVLGLKMEDTVAHYDTLDGRTLVEPSNEVCLYSPRFGAVRQVVSLMADEEQQKLAGVHNPQRIEAPTTLQIPSGASRTSRRATRSPLGRPWPCAAGRATACCPAPWVRGASKTLSRPTKIWLLSVWACSRKRKCPSWLAAPMRPSPGLTPRPSR